MKAKLHIALRFLLISLLVIEVFSCKLFDSPAPKSDFGSLSGSVTDFDTKKAVQDAKVTISYSQNGTPATSSRLSGSDGKYNFDKLDGGDYGIEVTHSAYQTDNPGKTIRVNVGDAATYDAALHPVKSILNISPPALDFTGTDVSKTIILQNGIGQGTVGFTAKPTVPWISISPTSGTLKNTETLPMAVTVDRTGLSAGSYQGLINFIADNNSIPFNVSLQIANPNAPSVVTKKPTNITNSSAEVIGEVTNVGGSNVTQRGHCWGENPNPAINDGVSAKTQLGPGALGSFNSTVSPLKSGKRYYIRAYATNGQGTNYGETFAIETSQQETEPAVILTGPPTDINTNSAKLGGRITNNGGSAVIEHGHVWAITPNPTIANSKTTLGIGEVGKDFTSSLINLQNGVKYYVRAYAASDKGVGYSEEATFETRNPSTPPSIATGAPTGRSETYATFNANLNEVGSSPIVQHGFCWSTRRALPTIEADNKTAKGPRTTTGRFTDLVTTLQKGTNYYIRPYVSTQDGQTYYGPTTEVVTLENKASLYYPFNGDADDATVNGNAATVEGAKLANDRFGNPNRAYDLSKGHLRINNETIGKWDGNITYAFWVNISEGSFSGKDKVLISKSNGNCYDDAYTGFMLYIKPSESTDISFSTFYERSFKRVVVYKKSDIVNSWHHFAIVKEGVNVRFYLDGFLVKESIAYETFKNTYYTDGDPIRLGEYSRYCNNRLDPLAATMDEVRIYSYALTDNEVAEVAKR